MVRAPLLQQEQQVWTDSGACVQPKMGSLSLLVILLSTALCDFAATTSPYSVPTQHTLRTPSAKSKGQDPLFCYHCDSMEDGDLCTDLIPNNNSNFYKKCKPEEFYCAVKRISYTISTENSTTAPRIWSLQRSCQTNCVKGCIVIGERTKLFACTSCCNDKDMCNTGEGAAPGQWPAALSHSFMMAAAVVVLLLLTKK